MEFEKIKEAASILLHELMQEIEKGERQELDFTQVHELLAVAYEPVRFLASRAQKIRTKN